MKNRFISLCTAISLLMTMGGMGVGMGMPSYAAGGNEIAIMVEQNGFTSSNVGDDGDNTLLWKKGSSTLSGGQLVLTNNSQQAGSVVKRNQVKLTDGFSSYFQMNFSGNADGIAFILYKADVPKLGERGGALGYGDRGFAYHGADTTIADGTDNSIHDSIIVEFDTWKNYSNTDEQYDPNIAGYENHVAIMVDGNQVHATQSDPNAVYTNANLATKTINAWVDYQAGNGSSTTGTMTVTFGEGATKGDASNHTITRTIAIADDVPVSGDSVFAGFTSSTGGNATTQKLLKWYFKDAYVAGGLNPTAGTYTQSPATLSVVPNVGINPTDATILIKDEAGTNLTNETFQLYIDDVLIPEGTPGDYTTGAGANYLYSIPNNLTNGNHVIRVVGVGGVTNFAQFSVNKHTITYNGNGNTGGSVPVLTTHNNGTNAGVSSNTGTLVKTGFDFAGWNTNADGSGTTYYASNGQITGISNDITLYAMWSKFTASLGNTSFIQSGSPVIIDSGIIIDGFTGNIDGAKVMIQNKKTGDTLSFTNTVAITGNYDSASGVLTLTGSATPLEYQAALRTIKFTTTSNDTTNRTILFSLGEGLYYATNGHFYEFVNGLNVTWDAAKLAAEGRNLYGKQGYLATLTSSGENAFVTEKVKGLGWIGAKDIHYVNVLSDDTLGDWRWVTGPEGLANGNTGTQFYTGYATASGSTVTYSNWWGGEPNNGDNRECVAHIFGPIGTMPAWAGGAQPGEWNDFEVNRNDGAVKGYVVEYGGMPNDTPITIQASKTLAIALADATAPIITPGAVNRTGDLVATVKFTSNENGAYYYAIVADGAAAPNVDTSGVGTACSTAETTITNPVGLSAGAKDIYIKVKDASNNVSNVLKMDIPVYTASGSGGSGGSGSGGSTPAAGQSSVIVVVNGKEQNAGKETRTTESGKTTVKVEVDQKVVESKIDEAIRNNPTGIDNTIQVPVADTKSEVVKVELTGDIVKKLEDNTFDVSVKRDNVEYIIPADEFTITKVAQNLGVLEKDYDDIKVEVQITKLNGAVVEKYNEVAEANGAELVFPPVEFEIVAKTIQANGTVKEQNISRFSNYVERVMEIPTGVDPNKITTGIVFNADGSFSHVPTVVFSKGGKWYAKLNSLTNSDYSVIWHPITVKSVEKHWSKNAVNDMASRLVIFNPESFSPDQAITRADFAEYIVRALGLYREDQKLKNTFKDVKEQEARTQGVLIASSYGIITGYTDGTFKPNQEITREEAMVMYLKAMKVTKLTGHETNKYKNYSDYNQVSDWASSSVKDVLAANVFNGTSQTTLAPKAHLTYAEAAQAIKNLLVESKLINR